MKKILFIITKSNWGGAQRYVFDLATALPKEQFEAVVALGGTGQPDALQGTLDSKLRAADIRTIFVPSFMRDLSLRREWRTLHELVDIIKNERPDVVHLNSSKAGGLGALAARLARWPTANGMQRAKIVFTSHGLPWDEDRSALARAALWLASWATFLLCDTVITITRDNAGRARLPFCGRKIKLVHNGLSAPPFLPQGEARAALDIDTTVPVIGTIANLEWNKGLHYLVRAAGQLSREGKAFLLYIIGEGEERRFLETLIEEENLGAQVRLAGFKDEAWRYLRAFDLFALPSLKEGLPYVLLEAGQAGLPCVGSNIPGVAEIVGDGVSGLLYKPKDHRALARKLKLLLEDLALRERLGSNLLARVQSEFALDKMTRNTIALYLY